MQAWFHGALWKAGLAGVPAMALAAMPALADVIPGGRSGMLELDRQAVVVYFTLPGVLHETHGTFRMREGRIALDAATGQASGVVVVDAASGDSGNARRDERMRRILDTDRFPEILFRPVHVDATLRANGEFEGAMRGVLTLRGTDHDVTAVTRGRLTGSEVRASCHFLVPYVAWGLEDPSFFLFTVGPEVAVDVHAGGRVRWADARRDPKEGLP